jgi:hypothetical protein
VKIKQDPVFLWKRKDATHPPYPGACLSIYLPFFFPFIQWEQETGQDLQWKDRVSVPPSPFIRCGPMAVPFLVSIKQSSEYLDQVTSVADTQEGTDLPKWPLEMAMLNATQRTGSPEDRAPAGRQVDQSPQHTSLLCQP